MSNDQTLIGIIPANSEVVPAVPVTGRSTAGEVPQARPTNPDPPRSTRQSLASHSAVRAHSRLSPKLAQLLEQIPQGWPRFETQQEIGRGGCGVVTAAMDRQLGREVVVKRIIDSGLSDEAIARFINEAEITGQLAHPGIVPVHELGIDDQGLPYYVMKRLQGVTLAQRINEYRSLPNGPDKMRQRHELLQRFVSVCQTLAFAHRRGIIHRDLKPANIMLGEFGETIVLDWGLARSIRRDGGDSSSAKTMLVNRPATKVSPRFAAEEAIVHRLGNSHLTMDGRVMGTAAYMAPEQALGQNEQLNEQSDVFSLGVILYEILSGVSPFQSNSVEHTIQKVAHCDYRPLSQYRAGIAKPLMAICHHALQLDQAKRYGNASDLAADLLNHLASQPVTVYSERIWERWDRWAGRHQSLFRAVFFSAITIALTASIAAGWISRSHRAEWLAKQSAVSAHDAAQVALAGEQLSRQQAQQRLIAARKAADQWLIDLSGSLQFYPGLESLRHNLLQQGNEHYQTLLEQLQESPDDRAESAYCHIRLGDLARLTGQLPSAIEHYLSAIKTFDELLQVTPLTREQDLMLRTQAANARIGQALAVLASAETSSAVAGQPPVPSTELTDLLNSSRMLAQQALDIQPDSVEARSALARSLLVKGRACRQYQELDQSIEAFRLATQQAEILVQQTPDLRQNHLKATILQDSLVSLKQNRAWADAAHTAEQLVQTYDRLLRVQPDRPDWLEGRSLANSAVAEIHQVQHQPAAALNAYRMAESDLQTAWQQLLTEPFYRENQAILQANMALASGQTGQFADAEQHWLTAIDDLRWLAQFQGITNERVVRMAHCYRHLAAIQGLRNPDEARQWLELHLTLANHLNTQADAETQRLARQAFTEHWLLAANLVKDEPEIVQIQEHLSACLQEVESQGSTTKPQDQDALEQVWLKARILSAIASLWEKSQELSGDNRSGSDVNTNPHAMPAHQAWQELAGKASPAELDSIYGDWLEWRLGTWNSAMESQPSPVEIAANWTQSQPNQPTAWQYYAWAAANDGRYELAQQASERARQLRRGWPQPEDEYLARLAEAKLGRAGSAERWQLIRGQLEQEIYQTPLRRWLSGQK